MTIDEIICRLSSDTDCSISLRPSTAEVPDYLPADVQEFFSRTHGGRLYYHPDYPTPQFGCELRLYADNPVGACIDSLEMTFCEGAEFEHLYRVAEFTDTGDYDFAAVSTAPDTLGFMYFFRYSLGDPIITWPDRLLLARSFSRWLAMHIEAWERYRNDWRDGLAHYRFLCDEERRLASSA